MQEGRTPPNRPLGHGVKVWVAVVGFGSLLCVIVEAFALNLMDGANKAWMWPATAFHLVACAAAYFAALPKNAAQKWENVTVRAVVIATIFLCIGTVLLGLSLAANFG